MGSIGTKNCARIGHKTLSKRGGKDREAVLAFPGGTKGQENPGQPLRGGDEIRWLKAKKGFAVREGGVARMENLIEKRSETGAREEKKGIFDGGQCDEERGIRWGFKTPKE